MCDCADAVSLLLRRKFDFTGVVLKPLCHFVGLASSGVAHGDFGGLAGSPGGDGLALGAGRSRVLYLRTNGGCASPQNFHALDEVFPLKVNLRAARRGTLRGGQACDAGGNLERGTERLCSSAGPVDGSVVVLEALTRLARRGNLRRLDARWEQQADFVAAPDA